MSTTESKDIKLVAGVYMWRVRGGFFRRCVSPAVVECMDGSLVTVDLQGYASLSDLRAHLGHLLDYYWTDIRGGKVGGRKNELNPSSGGGFMPRLTLSMENVLQEDGRLSTRLTRSELDDVEQQVGAIRAAYDRQDSQDRHKGLDGLKKASAKPLDGGAARRLAEAVVLHVVAVQLGGLAPQTPATISTWLRADLGARPDDIKEIIMSCEEALGFAFDSDFTAKLIDPESSFQIDTIVEYLVTNADKWRL